jgi:histidine triad (HIT) family protein
MDGLLVDHFEFIFDGGTIDLGHPSIRTHDPEIAEARFVEAGSLGQFTIPKFVARIIGALSALAHGCLAYMENHVLVSTTASKSAVSDDFYCQQILGGRMPAVIEMESPHVPAIHHTRPSYPVHIVVVPKHHMGSLSELPDHDPALVMEMMRVLATVSARVEATHGACRVITNLGSYQDTRHLHWHVVSGDRLPTTGG